MGKYPSRGAQVIGGIVSMNWKNPFDFQFFSPGKPGWLNRQDLGI